MYTLLVLSALDGRIPSSSSCCCISTTITLTHKLMRAHTRTHTLERTKLKGVYFWGCCLRSKKAFECSVHFGYQYRRCHSASVGQGDGKTSVTHQQRTARFVAMQHS